MSPPDAPPPPAGNRGRGKESATKLDSPRVPVEPLIALPPSLHPPLNHRIGAALARVRSDRRLLGCPHLSNAGPAAVVCAEHPAAGLLCASCTDQHVRRHSSDVESCCDVCGDHVSLIHPVIAGSGRPMTLVVRPTSGRRHLYFGDVVVVCLGACLRCMRVPAEASR